MADIVPHCIRCGDDVEAGSDNICYGCDGALCSACKTSGDFNGIPTKEPMVECDACDVSMARAVSRLKWKQKQKLIKEKQKEEKKEKELKLKNLSASLVKTCPYCGASDWDKPGKKPDGRICTHPTKTRWCDR